MSLKDQQKRFIRIVHEQYENKERTGRAVDDAIKASWEIHCSLLKIEQVKMLEEISILRQIVYEAHKAFDAIHLEPTLNGNSSVELRLSFHTHFSNFFNLLYTKPPSQYVNKNFL